MKRKIDLVEINPNCMSALLENNITTIYSQPSIDSIYAYVSNLFLENNLDTNASRRLLLNIKKSRSLVAAQTTVTNSLLAGRGLAVN